MKKVILSIVFLMVLAGCTAVPQRVIRVTATPGGEAMEPVVVEMTATPAPTETPEPTSTPRPTPRPTRKPLVACTTLHPAFVDALDEVAFEWDDAVDIAVSTSRMNLAGPVGELQSIRRDVARWDEVPTCGEDAHIALLVHMETTIDVMLEFMTADDDLPAYRYEMVGDTLDDYVTEFDKLDDSIWEAE